MLTSSRSADVTSGPESADLILGLSAGSRYLGCALVLRGEPLHLWTHRSQSVGPEHGCARTSVERLLDSHRQTLVALAVADGAVSQRAAAGHRLREALADRQNIVFEVTPLDMAEVLGLETDTRVAVHDYVVRRYPPLATYFHSARRYQTASERYWEDAIVAAAACLTVFSWIHRDLEPT